MTITPVNNQHEISEFVLAVRARLVDLPTEDQLDLTEGLEADLVELVDERGLEALGQADEYARELRLAAGLSAEASGPSPRASAPRWMPFLDSCRNWALGALPGRSADFAEVLRPTWWVFRAWLAVKILAGMSGHEEGVIPDLGGPLFGLVLFVLAAVISIKIGQGQWWPGNRAKTGQRTLLLALNAFAIVMVVPILVMANQQRTEWVYTESDPSSQLSYNGVPLGNIYPYDAAGNPLIGVQLVDEQGRRLTIDAGSTSPIEDGVEMGLVPWLNGSTELFSVFPLAHRQIDDSGNLTGPIQLPAPPYANVGAVNMEGVTPSLLVTKPVKGN